MPWEITIRNRTPDQPLGTREDVGRRLSATLPGVEWGRPPLPPAEFLSSLPPAVRDAFTRPQLTATFEEANVSIEIVAPDVAVIPFLIAEVRGKGNPLAALKRLCQTDWCAVCGDDGTLVDLSGTDVEDWDRFTEWRDQAIDLADEEDAAGSA